MAIFGYARVSTTEQNLDRQLEQLKAIVPDERNIITDKQSGKDFNRAGFNSLIGTKSNTPLLREGDVLVIVSLDRLGRNYTEMKTMWDYITNTLKADIKVLDMPLLDTTQSGESLDRRFIADLVLQILSYTAEKERLLNKTRREQGVDCMPIGDDGKRYSKRTGNPIGRPKAEYPDNWESVYKSWQAGEITAVKTMEILSMTKSLFYKMVKQYKANNCTI